MPQNNLDINNSPDKPLVILICNKTQREPIENVLKDNFQVVFQTKYQEIQHTYRSKQISLFVSCVSKIDCKIFELKNLVCEQFPSIPKIAIINDSNDIDLILKCGEIGIDKVLLKSQLSEICLFVHDLSSRKGRSVTLSDLGFKMEGLPELVKKALLIIEKYYLSIRFIEDIANRLEVSYSLLACAVQKSPISSLKKILLHFKIRHSLYLLKDNNLSIQEISALSGFSDEKRYREGMRRIFGKTPTECQCELLSTTIDEFWKRYTLT